MRVRVKCAVGKTWAVSVLLVRHRGCGVVTVEIGLFQQPYIGDVSVLRYPKESVSRIKSQDQKSNPCL